MAAGPHSIAAVDKTLQKLAASFDSRSPTFGNRERMNKLLGLMALACRGQVNWADRIRDRLIATRGRAARQRPHDDRAGRPSLLS